jgi:hypothetical protein
MQTTAENSQKLTEFEKRFGALKTEHQVWVPAYKDLSTYINPTRGIFNNDRTRVGKMIDHQTLLSGHATHALRIFASGMNSGMTNKSSTWFRVTFDDINVLEEEGVKEWLEIVQNKMYGAINKSNLHDVFYSAYEELGQFGTACFLILEDFEMIIRARSFTAGEYFLGIGPNGKPNAFAREFEMTVGQLISEFGEENCSDNVVGQFKQNQVDVKIKVRHLIEENKTRDPMMSDFKNMPYRSVYWEAGNVSGKFLATRGFKSFRVVAPRWDTITTEMVYGYGPGWHAIGAIKEMQKTRQDKLIAQEKTHNPPMIQDSTVDGHANLLPGGVTTTSSSLPNSGVRPAYQINPALESFVQLLEEEKEEINQFFFVNLFLMLMNVDKTQMTATEVAERQQEKLMMMGPALHRLDEEMLTKSLELVYETLIDNGMIPEPPDAIQGLDMKIEFTSILAQAQKALGITKIERVLNMFTNPQVLQAFPTAIDNFDIDEIVRQVNDMEGASTKILLTREVVAQLREDRQIKQNQAIAMQAASMGADAANKLGNTPMGTDSALDRMAPALPALAGAGGG